MIWLVLIWSMVAGAVPYEMNDVGGIFELPDSWKGKSYSDEDLQAETKGDKNKLKVRAWMTEYQVPIDAASSKAFAEDYARRIGVLGGKKITETSQEITTLAGRPILWTTQRFGLGDGIEAMAQTAAFTGHGNVIHIRILSHERQKARGRKALNQFVEAFKLTKEPGQEKGGEVEAEDGFTTTLPSGWRVPIGKERSRVRKITDGLWVSKKGTDPCWVAIRPVPIGKPDVMFACGRYWGGGPLDEHSFSGVDQELKELYFREGASELGPTESISIGDRMGLLFRPGDGANTWRLATAPYDKGLIAIWLKAGSKDGGALDDVIKGVAERTRFTGPEGGKPVIRADKWVGYYLAHRKTSPFVLGPIFLVLGLVGFVVAKRRKASDAEWDDVTEM